MHHRLVLANLWQKLAGVRFLRHGVDTNAIVIKVGRYSEDVLPHKNS